MSEISEIVTVIEEMPHAEFFNEHGERFVIYTNGTLVFMAGDEVDQMVDDKHKIEGKYMPLFNSHFNLWSADELVGLGRVLKTLGNRIKHKTQQGS